MRNVIEGFESHSTGEGGVPGQTDHMFFSAPHIPGRGHAKGRGQGRASMTRSETVVFALRTEHESIQPTGLPNGVKPIPPAGQKLVDVGLVADVKNKVIRGGIKDSMQGNG